MAKIKPSAAKAFTKASPVNKLGPRSNQTKAKISKQGRMDPKLPVNQIITLYTPESPPKAHKQQQVVVVEDEEEEEEEYDDLPEMVDDLDDKSDQLTSMLSTIATEFTIGTIGHNVLVKETKNKHLIYGQDNCAVNAWKQGRGGTGLRGPEKKSWLALKSMKMVISHLVKAAINLEQCEPFLTMVHVNLKGVYGYQLLSADIVAHICDILANYCHMENVDVGSNAEYFDTRFADTRNRRNYVPE